MDGRYRTALFTTTLSHPKQKSQPKAAGFSHSQSLVHAGDAYRIGVRLLSRSEPKVTLARHAPTSELFVLSVSLIHEEFVGIFFDLRIA
jgi:hypothetical protein